jgi:hypothetical protein
MFKEENKYWLNTLFSDTKLLGNGDKILLFESKYQEEFRIRVFPYLKSGKFKDVLDAISWRDSNNIIHFYDEDYIFLYLILNENFYLIQKHLNSLFPNSQIVNFEISKKFSFLKFVFFNSKDYQDSFVNLDFRICKEYLIKELNIVTETDIINSSSDRGARINTFENKVLLYFWKLVVENKFQNAIELILIFSKTYNTLYAKERWETVYNSKSIILLNRWVSINLSATSSEISSLLEFIFNYCKDLIQVGKVFNINIPVLYFININFSTGFDLKLKEYENLINKVKIVEKINSSLTFGQISSLLYDENLIIGKIRIKELLIEKVQKGDYLIDSSWNEIADKEIYSMIVRKGYYYQLI